MTSPHPAHTQNATLNDNERLNHSLEHTQNDAHHTDLEQSHTSHCCSCFTQLVHALITKITNIWTYIRKNHSTKANSGNSVDIWNSSSSSSSFSSSSSLSSTTHIPLIEPTQTVAITPQFTDSDSISPSSPNVFHVCRRCRENPTDHFKKDDINKPDFHGNTVLHRACQNEHEECVKALLKYANTQVNYQNNHRSTPLHMAAENGHVECVELLVTHKTILVNICNLYGYTPLHYAAIHNEVEYIKLLLAAKNIDVNIKDTCNATPLALT